MHCFALLAVCAVLWCMRCVSWGVCWAGDVPSIDLGPALYAILGSASAIKIALYGARPAVPCTLHPARMAWAFHTRESCQTPRCCWRHILCSPTRIHILE